MSFLHLAEEADSREKQYGDLGAMLPKLLHGADEIIQGESMPLFRSADLLIRNSAFTSPDAIAELLVNDGIEILPKASYLISKHNIIPVRLRESGEYFLIYAPDNGEGQLQDVNNLGWHLPVNFDHVARDVRLEHVNLVVCTHSHFQDIFSFIHDTQKARNFISVFDDLNASKINELIESVIASLRKLGASDLHVEPGIKHADILMRLFGLLQPIPGEYRRISLQVADKIATVLIQHCGKDLKAGEPQDGSFRFEPDGTVQKGSEGFGKIITTLNKKLHGTDYRVSIIPVVGEHFASVVRLLMKPEGIKKLGDLGYESKDPFIEAGEIANGLVFVCGPTGGGKTTTLAALLNELRDPTRKTLSIEDPVEIRMEGIVQSQVNEKKGYTMATALRRFLRHDPDRIFVAEVRDSETAELAVQASNTGHAVYTTLHANTAAQSIRRLYQLGVDPIDIATTVRFIFAQRLVEELSTSSDAVEYYDAASDLSVLFGETFEGPIYLRRPLTSEGIVGRLPIFERITMTDDLVELLETKGHEISSPEIEKISLQEGFEPMEIYALRQTLKGLTHLDGLFRHLNKARMKTFRDLGIAMVREYGIKEIPNPL